MLNNTSNLIFLDKLFAPLYFICSKLIALIPSKEQSISNTIVIKLFGMGSIVRMASVLNESEKINFKLVTLSKNQTICNELGISTHTINGENIFLAFIDTCSVLLMIWKAKKTRVIDMERKSNLSGTFRLISSIGKECSSFSFEDENSRKGNQRFISLKNKSIFTALGEMFDNNSIKPITVPINTRASRQIIVNVNAGEYMLQRRYPINHFLELIKRLHQSKNAFEFVITGLEKERGYTQQLSKQLEQLAIPYVNLVGKLSLNELIRQLKNAYLLITNDSGPLHLAYYFDVPTIAIWGPTSAELVGYPESAYMKNISLSKACSPCFIHPKSKVAAFCNQRIDCLQELRPQQVYDKVMELSQLLEIERIN